MSAVLSGHWRTWLTDEEDDDTGQDYLCPRTWTPVSPIVTRPSFVDKGSIVKRAALRSLIQLMQQRCRGSLRHYISRVLQSPLPTDSPLHDGDCRSIQRSLPRDAWVTYIDLVDTYFHIPIHRDYRKCIWFQTRDTICQFRSLLFGLLQHLRYSPRLWQRSNAGTRDGHQSLSVPGRLTHLFTISRPVTPRHWSVQVLNLCHSMGLLIHDKQSELIPKQKFQAKEDVLIRGRSCSVSCVHTENGSSRTAAHIWNPTLHLST